MSIKEHNHKYFTDKQLHKRIGLGTAEYVDGVLYVKCYNCFVPLEASTKNFNESNIGGIYTRCKGCSKLYASQK